MQLKDEAAAIIASAQSENDEIIYNFILIPFSDPGKRGHLLVEILY